MTKSSVHQSVLTEETLAYLAPKSGGIYLDGTFGGGGHTRAILEQSAPNGRIYALDLDEETVVFAEPLRAEFGERFVYQTLAYSQVSRLGVMFDGALLDLGLSSDQLDQSGRGFSFKVNAPLDMRFDPTKGQTAAQLLGQASVMELERIFREYGEDRRPGSLARKIVATRRTKPIRTTFDLVAIVGTTDAKVLSRVFQALRIAVNDELNQLKRGLDAIESCLKPGGKLVVISFHSLEDRIVKEFMRTKMEVLTKKPLIAEEGENRTNPRARSAKLRAGKKLVDKDED